MKECRKCKTEFPATLEYFHEAKGNKDGLNRACKGCIAELVREYYEKNKEKVKEYHINRSNKRREEAGQPPLSTKIAKEGHKICTICDEELIATNEYFHNAKNTQDGLFTQCKDCRNKSNRERAAIEREKERNFKAIETKYVTKKDKIKLQQQKTEILRDKKEEEAYRKMINEPIVEGLKLNKIKLELGQSYRIAKPLGRKKQEYFKGTMIHETNRHITLKSKNGVCETFLKVDLLLQEYSFEEVV